MIIQAGVYLAGIGRKTARGVIPAYAGCTNSGECRRPRPAACRRRSRASATLRESRAWNSWAKASGEWGLMGGDASTGGHGPGP